MKYKLLRYWLLLLIMITGGSVALQATDYIPVTSASQLQAGKKYLFVGKYKTNSMESPKWATVKDYNSGNKIFNSVEITPTEDENAVGVKFTDPADAITFTLGGEEGAWTFLGSDGKYMSLTNTSNQVHQAAAVESDNQKWTIAFETGAIVSIKNKALTARIFWSNINSTRFACYSNKQTSNTMYLYVEAEGGGETPTMDYYVVGNMTEWGPNADYKMTRNEASTEIEEYMIDLTLKANDEFKVAKSDGSTIDDANWYPTGMGNNYKITADGEYTVYFRPNADGGDDWHYKYIYVAAKAAPAPTFRDIKIDFTAHSELTTGSDVYITVAENGDIGTTDDPAKAAATIKASAHGSYGSSNFTASVPVQGCVKITYATHDYGNDIVVTNTAGAEVAKFNTMGAKWMNDHNNVVVAYYRTNEATTLNFSNANYNPYFAVEAIDPADIPAEVTKYNVTFAAGEGTGTAPKALEIEAGQKFNAPKNYYLYKEGATLTGWNDGTKTYAIGEEITPEADMTLTAQFTANEVSLADRTAAVTLTFPLDGYNDNPQHNIGDGKTGIIVTQATVNGKTIDVKADVDASAGKFVANGTGWHQVNTGTKVSVPSCKDATFSVKTYQNANALKFGETAATAEADPATYTATTDDASLVIEQTGNGYWNNLTVTLPVASTPESNYYIAGSINDWGPKAEYKMTRNTGATDVEEYMIDLTLKANDEFKVIKSMDGTSIATWYPDGMGNNYKITADGNYTVYFRPNADGGDDWHYKYIYVATKAAQDVTATWDFVNNCAGLAPKSESGSYTAETMASDVAGISMTIVYNGGVIKNNDNSYQVSNGVVMQIPVKNAGDLVTVKGYPGYSKYTIAGGTEELTGDNSYKAKISDAEAGYVAVTSKDGNNYYLSISVVQYAPKEKKTVVDEPATITFPFGQGTEGQKATFSNADYFLNSKIIVGSNWFIKDKITYAGTDETRLEPIAQHDADLTDDDAVIFSFAPLPGFVFTPTKVSFKSNRFGTDNGLIDAYWLNANGTTVELEKEIKPERNNSEKNTFKEYELTGATPGEGSCGLKLFLYHLQSAKQIGLADIIIEGTLNGTEKDVPILASFKINGNEYTVEDVFGDNYEATLELPKAEPMVSNSNPLTEVTATSGEIGTITYQEKENACTVTIPMTAGDTQMDYVLNVVFKPDFMLSYLDVEGNVLKTQLVEKDKTIGEFAYDIANVPATKDGYKARGWFKTPVIGEKFTTDQVITADTKLYAIQTKIETVSTHDKYTFDLTDKLFYAEDHEAFVPKGEGFYYHDAQHGWAFKAGNSVDLLVGPKAVISVSLCKYGTADETVITENGNEIGRMAGKSTVDIDGDLVSYTYEGTGGVITLNFNTTGEMYIHAIKIANIAETNYDQDGKWYFVKAGDAGSLLDVLDVLNGANASADAERAYIFLPNGIYDLDATVKTAISGKNISIIGESMEGTIITTKPDVSIEGLGKADMFQASSQNLYLQDLTLKNALDYYKAGSAGRAAVLQDIGTRTIGKNITMLSYQDTYYSSNNSQQAYWENCDIHGTVDFICGGGDIRFQNTTISLEPRALDGKGGRTIVAPTTTTNFGYVFDGCTVVDLATEGKGDWNLGRTWQNTPITVYLNTTLDAVAEQTLVSKRWTEKGMNNKDPKLFGEFGTMNAAGANITPANNSITSFGGVFETILSAEQAAEFSYDKMFTDWKPATLAKQLEAPIATYSNGVVTITPADNGAIAYLIEKNGEFLAFTTEFTVNVEVDPEKDELTIRAANTMGGFGEPKHIEGTTGIEKVTNSQMQNGEQVIYNLSGQRVSNATKGIYIINGHKVVMK